MVNSEFNLLIRGWRKVSQDFEPNVREKIAKSITSGQIGRGKVNVDSVEDGECLRRRDSRKLELESILKSS